MAKVNVITDIDVEFGKYSWWSKWVDIAVYDYNSVPWLIQMKVSRSNKKKFRSVSMTGIFYKQSTSIAVGDLTQMKALVKDES